MYKTELVDLWESFKAGDICFLNMLQTFSPAQSAKDIPCRAEGLQKMHYMQTMILSSMNHQLD